MAATCALAGAAAGISESSAATTKSATTKSTTRRAIRHDGAGFPGPGGAGGPGGGAVHEVEEVLDKAGTAYISQTVDSGEVTALDTSAGTVTLKEGTSTVTYATPTITIPSGASVTLDGVSSSLEKLKTGDHATISSSSDGTTVFATDSSFQPGGGHGWGGGPGQAPPSGQAPGGQSPASNGSSAG
jgi:hypothetical protein